MLRKVNEDGAACALLRASSWSVAWLRTWILFEGVARTAQ